MKRLIKSCNEDIFCMSKIVRKHSITDVGEFIYFSECNSSHGPRIKFYGGTKETSTTKDSPTVEFTSSGDCTLLLADWMNKKNCPNAFDRDYMSVVYKFIETYLPILLLVWFHHLDEAEALEYFHGHIDFVSLIDSIDYDIPEGVDTLDKLDTICRKNNWYKF